MNRTNYKTKQKLAIMQCIKASGNEHFTIDSLYEKLNRNGNTVGRTTVYRFLENLSKDGILRKFTMPQGESSCYQYIGEHSHCHEHFHLKCEKCGTLFHLECDEMCGLTEHIKNHHKFHLNPLKTVIYGMCEDCAAK